jgi:hypothetical protein
VVLETPLHRRFLRGSVPRMTGEREVLGLDVGPGSGYTLGSQSTRDVGDDWSLVIRINDTGSTSARFPPRAAARGSKAELTVAMPQAEYA